MSSDELSALSHLTPSLLCAMVVTPSGRLAMRLCNGARSEYFYAPEDLTEFVRAEINAAEARYRQRIADRAAEEAEMKSIPLDLAALGLAQPKPMASPIKRRF